MIYAVIDTNVIVSSFITRHIDAVTKQVVQAIYDKRINPLYNGEIIAEYREVLSREHIRPYAENSEALIETIIEHGTNLEATPYPESMPDEKDRVFFEVALSAQDDDAKLVTGNVKHFPQVHFVITPGQMMSLLRDTSVGV